MANMNAPTGLWPTGTVTGAAYNEQGRLYYIANDATNTYAIGDVVTIKKGGDINGVPQCVKATASSTPLGVVVGFEVSVAGPSLQGTNLNLSQIYLAQSAGTQYAYVVDDPNVVFQVQSSNTASGVVGSTAILVATTADSNLSQSSPLSSEYVTIDASAVATSMFQVIGVAQRQQNAVGAYNNVLVVWNKHQFKQVQGA